MVLSFVVIGAAASPRFSGTILLVTLLAYFLALGIGAHFLDQLPGMGTRYVRHWPNAALWGVGFATIGVAVAIGVYAAATTLGWWFLLLVGIQAVCAVGYPLGPVFHGVFHRESVFALSWGALPFITSYFAQSGQVTLGSVLIGAAFAGIAVVELRVSRISRELRSRAANSDVDPPDDGDAELPAFRSADVALVALAIGTVLLAVGLLLTRVIPGI